MTATGTRVVRVGTRASVLARTQSSLVAQALAARSGLSVELVAVSTRGDVDTGPLSVIGGTGVFVSALRRALAEGEVDVAVHSLKDLPTAPAPGVRLAAVPLREDPRDVLVCVDRTPLDRLPAGARVGTGSPRRAAVLAQRGLTVVDIRGNVDSRLARVGRDLDAVVVAAAGLARLGRLAEAAEILAPDVMVPAPGQGALGVETREGDPLGDVVAALDHRPTRLAVTAERALLAALEVGCSAPVGALAVPDRTDRPDPCDGEALRFTLHASLGVEAAGGGWRGVVRMLAPMRTPAGPGEPPGGSDPGDVAAREAGASLAARLLAARTPPAGAPPHPSRAPQTQAGAR